MKNRRSLAFAVVLCAVLSGPAQAADEDPPHAGAIESVTVFSDRALVVRRHDVHLKEGRVRLRFTALPATFQAEGLRAQGDGEGVGEGIEIAGLAVRPAVVAPDPDVEAVRARLDSLKKDLRLETDRQASIAEQMKLLDSLGKGTTERSDGEMRAGELHVKSWSDAVHFLEEQRAAYQEKMRATEERRAKVQQSVKEVGEELARLSNSRRYAPVEVEVLCQGKVGASGTVRLSYIVTSVSWDGIYDLRGSAEGKEFSLESLATVRQNTGEDWRRAKITLSTARPSLAIAPPAMKPWHLRALSPGGRAEVQNRAQQAGDDGVATGRPEEASMERAGEQSTVVVELPGLLSIASGGVDHRLTVHRATLSGSLSHVVVAGRSSAVFLRAALKNTTGRPIFADRVNVFLDGGFIGTTVFEDNPATGEDMALFLGPDQRMHVRRSLVKGEIVGSGLINKTVEIENRWQIEVTNTTRRTRTVVVRDQIPVSADPRISARFLGSSVADVKPDAQGLLRWTLEIGPGEKRTVEFGYSMQIPQDVWDAMEQQTVREKQRRGLNDAPAASPAQENKKYDLEKMFYK